MRRDIILLIGLFGALATLFALGPGSGETLPGSSASSHASGSGGTLALYRWLEALDYDSERLEYRDFALEPDDAMLIVLEPSSRYSREDAAAVQAWVAAGGTLLVAESRPGNAAAAPLLDAFELQVVRAPNGAITGMAPVLQPALGSPAVERLRASAETIIQTERSDVASLAGTADAPVLVGLQHGEGYVYASSAVHPFTNAGLRDADNAALVLNLLRRIPASTRVVFDEIHHGFVGEPSLRRLLLGTPWGWAALYGALVGAAYLLFTGRRFGQPVPLRAETDRRSSAEYLESMAGLLRRAGKGEAMVAHYRAAFKRRLARATGLSPDQDDATLVAALATTRPTDAAAVANLLAQMSRPPADDAALLRLVAEADRLLDG